tara:strand:- start:173 stop:613 length:441 start_codon:yes stop_codon:yes gene_type:complete
MRKILIRLNNLTKKQLKEICKRMKIKCPDRKRDIVNILLQPLETKYKMEKNREQKRREREEALKQKRKERKEARELQKKSRELQKKSRELIREARKIERDQKQEARKIEREIKREERQRLIEKWKQEGKDNLEIVELLMQMNVENK